MKQINHILRLIFIFIGTNAFSQTIVLNACHPLIENQDYTFQQKKRDATGRNIFETNPVNENSPCGGVGNCEFQIAWNQIKNRWEVYVDDGNGTFSNSYVLYYNTEASKPNPPSSLLGVWVEETLITQSQCGSINSITGDVENTVLGITNFDTKGNLTIAPNPASDFIEIFGLTKTEHYKIYNILGGLVNHGNVSNNDKIDIQDLKDGIYFLKFENGNTHKYIKK
ncbi:MAG: Uncharacterised protein [Polaribacter sejongensis]|nr:MAG: Uncharacterised protein [Polaribacter sejongensis]